MESLFNIKSESARVQVNELKKKNKKRLYVRESVEIRLDEEPSKVETLAKISHCTMKR